METKTYKTAKFIGLDIKKMAELASKHFTKPPLISREVFKKCLENEIELGIIKISVEKVVFKRKIRK